MLRKYPVRKWTYNKVVGSIRVKNIESVLCDLGFSVRCVLVENSDVDIWVTDGSSLVLVIEVTNWRKSSDMSHKKAISLQSNFRKYRCHKLFVCSFYVNFEHKEYFIDRDVDVMILGFQTQPYYDWFLDRGRSYGMRPDDSRTL